MASESSNTPLHYDNMNNLFAQLDGRKRFLLFNPSQSDLLYPGPLDIRTRHLSGVDVADPDLEKFPEFARAEYWEALVLPGDLLFIPAFWWHQVSAPDISVSVNYWWRADVRDCACPSYFRQLYLDLVMADVRGLFVTHDLRALGNGSAAVLALAEQAIGHGEPGVAARLCGGAIVAAAKDACAEQGIAPDGGIDDAFAELEKLSVWSAEDADLARHGMAVATAAHPGGSVPAPDVLRIIERLRVSTLTWEYPARAAAADRDQAGQVELVPGHEAGAVVGDVPLGPAGAGSVRWQARVITDVFPAGVAAVEVFGAPLPTPSLFAQEARLVEGAVERRRSDFATVRACARQAMGRLGFPRRRSCAGRAGSRCGLPASSAA